MRRQDRGRGKREDMAKLGKKGSPLIVLHASPAEGGVGGS